MGAAVGGVNEAPAVMGGGGGGFHSLLPAVRFTFFIYSHLQYLLSKQTLILSFKKKNSRGTPEMCVCVVSHLHGVCVCVCVPLCSKQGSDPCGGGS